MALCYNDRSVLENYHLYKAFSLLKEVNQYSKHCHWICPTPWILKTAAIAHQSQYSSSPSSPHLIPPYQHLTGWSQHLQGTQSWPISASSLTRYRHGAGYRHEQSFWPLEAHEAIAQFLRRVSSSTLITTTFPQSDLISVVATTAWSRLKVQRNPNSCVRYSTWQTFPILGRHGKSIRSGH